MANGFSQVWSPAFNHPGVSRETAASWQLAGRRHFGAGFGSPAGEFVAQLFHQLWLFGGQVGAFAQVLAQVVKFHRAFIKKLDQFEVSLANGAAGRPGGTVVMRIMPVQGSLA